MAFYQFLLIMLVVTIFETEATISDPLSDEFINYINSNQTLWRAGRNFHKDTPFSYIKRLMGSLRDNGVDNLPEKRYKNLPKKIRKQFDARQHWARCPTLNEIRDQGSCGSCWAISAASAMTDRVCIQSNGIRNFYFSEDDIITCCVNCGTGCNGGVLSAAWVFTQNNGTVSGGSYNSSQGCRPYEIAPCEHDVPGNRPPCSSVRTPMCKQQCQSDYKKAYSADKKKVGQVMVLKTVKNIQADIFKHGPVTTTFEVYSDFLHYKSGIYKYVTGDYVNSHSIKLLGWGVENNIKYWLAANSWNTDWGEGGFFKILRGKNHCGIETHAVSANVK